ncbi:MAG: VOC family protein [Dehalococcoidia bacterium]|nr:VOC family protein [Dehalococcoidia bacterium]
MKFYEKILGGKLELMTFGESQMPNVPPSAKERIIHSQLTKGALTLMGSDTMPGMPFKQGNNFSVTITCESAKEAEQLFKALSDRGQVQMPLAPTFFAEQFGGLTDKYGVGWMISYQGK